MSEMANEQTRKALIEKIIDIFVDVIGVIPREKVFPTTRPAIDFNIYTDDLTVYIMQVEK